MQYNNGVVEDLKPSNLVFEDKEVLNMFKTYEKIRTKRLLEVPNSWCIWGEMSQGKENQNEYNNLGSSIVGEKIFSPLLVIHDSELNPDLHLTDKIIIKNYDDFKEEILDFFDAVAQAILDSYNAEKFVSENKFAPKYEVIKPLTDGSKRVLLKFNIEKQNKEFWEFNNFSSFSDQSWGYLHKFFDINLKENKNSFIIYADNKFLVIIEDNHVSSFMKKMLENFEKREKYRGCNQIIAMTKKWQKYIKGKKVGMNDDFMSYIK